MPSLAVARQGLRVVWLSDGRVFAIGGNEKDNAWFNTVEMITREWSTEGAGAGIWRNVAGMLTARTFFGSITMHNLVLVAGGCTAGDATLSSVEVFTPPAATGTEDLGQWTGIKPMLSPMTCFAAVVYDEAVFVFGTLISLFELTKVATCYSVTVVFLQ